MKFSHPILIYLVISLISLLCAIALFLIGGSLAEITGTQESIVGLSFKAGGAIAGFILIFILSQKSVTRFYDDFRKTNPTTNIKVYLLGKPNGFERNDTGYEAEYLIFNEDSGESKSVITKPFWEAGYLTVFIKEVGDKDYLTIKIRNSKNISWASESFHSKSPKIAELNKMN